jgi:hypothetical protein
MARGKGKARREERHFPDWRPREVPAEVWLAEQRQVIAEHAARYTPEERLERWTRDHANDTPFVM